MIKNDGGSTFGCRHVDYMPIKSKVNCEKTYNRKLLSIKISYTSII